VRKLARTSPLTKLWLEIIACDDFAEAQYAPINRFSDGGSDFYLGFLYRTLTQLKGDVTTSVEGF